MFAKNLTTIMENKGFTQKDLRLLTGLKASAISQYVGGHNMPHPDKIEAIAKALDVPITALVDAAEVKKREFVLKKITISEAARRLGKSLDFVRAALEQGTAPFGFAAKVGDSWSYHISPGKFEAYLSGEI